MIRCELERRRVEMVKGRATSKAEEVGVVLFLQGGELSVDLVREV